MKPWAVIQKHRKILLVHGLLLLAGGVLYLLAMRGIGIPCLFRLVTGLLCPGCGNSRAALALLRLDFAAVLEYNLLFPLELGYVLWVYGCCWYSYGKGKGFAYRPPFKWMDVLLLAAVILWGILRNILPL